MHIAYVQTNKSSNATKETSMGYFLYRNKCQPEDPSLRLVAQYQLGLNISTMVCTETKVPRNHLT
jgi:hypothetical protein